jgi:acyl-CoA synthetase (NDP forming)
MTEQDTVFVVEPDAVADILRFGVRYPEHRLARSTREAMDFADEIGYPVVMKVVSRDIPHKTDVGGVITNVAAREDVEEACRRIEKSVAKAFTPPVEIEGILVCQQAAEGVEVIVGATEDPVYGMVLMFGLGGIFTEVLKDVSFRAVPLSRIDALEMIREIQGFPVLEGIRGGKRCDVEALADLLVAVSNYVNESKSLAELDLNPVRVYSDGVLALDVRILCKN